MKLSQINVNSSDTGYERYVETNETSKDVDLVISDPSGYSILEIQNGHIKTKNFDSNNITPGTDNYWKDKGILFFGDSITEQGWYCDTCCEILNCKQYNRGVSGSRVGVYSGTGYPSFVTRINQASNNSQTAKSSGMPNASLIDCVVIYGGTNDYWHTTNTVGPLGTFEADIDTTTFYGGLKYICNWFRTNYPKVPICVCTLLPGFANLPSDTQETYTDYIVNNNGGLVHNTKVRQDGNFTKQDYDNAIRNVAYMYGCYVIDLDKCSGITSYTQAQRNIYFNNGDGAHPGPTTGAVIIGRYIANYIKNNVTIIK